MHGIQYISLFGPSMKPSRDTIIDKITFLILFFHLVGHDDCADAYSQYAYYKR
jgi:hypothetical protein